MEQGGGGGGGNLMEYDPLPTPHHKENKRKERRLLEIFICAYYRFLCPFVIGYACMDLLYWNLFVVYSLSFILQKIDGTINSSFLKKE